VSDIEYLSAARGAAPAQRCDSAHMAMVFGRADGARTTIVINIDLVRVVGW
jgi:hypothetical protein